MPKTPEEPVRLWVGKKGEEPKEVWQSYDWTIISSDKYLPQEK